MNQLAILFTKRKLALQIYTAVVLVKPKFQYINFNVPRFFMVLTLTLIIGAWPEFDNIVLVFDSEFDNIDLHHQTQP